ncbi:MULTISPECIES: substrate-binding domain-containing protein [unclassified Arcicella]|uniref:PstS family phosphate ABC transporter substrate-binding protein n=1 Tax=unclassified Arcicella TaxID=2644986 RepID=UPI00285AD96F|nr:MULTISPECIES: substrate-binding domain-containing protein [unclassified Arcicella]MDR6564855.1 phosphate transport system substrate-binding protein [Arcicella sp. BE51]MDR6814622.1 phosphate transport system substrate-binding protein [Arcicella sp. BE140]MDR6826068.1 phosphate transport system substrate-binding protein [Arcicella sp. BE139]
MKTILNLSYSILLTATLFSCGKNTGKDGKELDGPAKGEITVAVDESFQPIMEAEKMAFEQTYPYTKINLVYKQEGEAVAMLLNDKARVAVITRELNDAEKKIYTDDKVTYRSFKFAGDALALITNKANRDTMITVNDIAGIMKGEKKKWSEISKSGSGEDIVLVFDGSNSSNLTFLVDKFGIDKKEKVSFFATKSNKEVIEYVKTHKNAMGVIGTNWISDGDDPASLGFIKEINVMSVSEKSSTNPEDYYQPFGYNLALKRYPLIRQIRLILKEPYMGLGTGFINYICLEQGQLIVLKGGLLPLTKPLQIRQVKMD